MSKAKAELPPIRYIVTIEDLTTGELTRRTGFTLKAAIAMAQEAHESVGQMPDQPLLENSEKSA